MSDDLFNQEVLFAEDVHTILSMNINSEKLEKLLKFILNMINRHEQGLRLALGKDSNSPSDSFSFQAFKAGLEEKFSIIEKTSLKNSMKIEEIRNDLHNRGDTVETLKYVLTTLDEHNSAMLRAEKMYNEVLNNKEAVEKSIDELKSSFNRYQIFNQPIFEKEFVQGIDKPREDFPKYLGKKYYVSNEHKQPTGIFAQKTGSGSESKPVLENESSSLILNQEVILNTTKDTQLPTSNESPEFTANPIQNKAFKRKDRILKPSLNAAKNLNPQADDDYISSASEKSFRGSSKSPIPSTKVEKLPSLSTSPVLTEILSRVESIEKSLQKQAENTEVNTRIRKLEAMYRFIEQILDSCEPLTLKNRDNIMHMVRNLKTLEYEMTNKLNTEDFDAIKNLVIALASGSPKHDPSPIIPTQEVNKIRLLEKRIMELEKNFSDIVKVYPENIEEVGIKLRRIEQKLAIKITLEDLEPIQGSIQELNEKIKNIALIEKGIKERNTNAVRNIDNLAMTALNRRVSAFEDIIRQLKIPSGLDLSQIWEETKKNWQNLQNLKTLLEEFKKQETSKRQELVLKLESKLEINTLRTLEENCTKMIQDLSEKCFNSFALRKDLKQLTKYLEDHPKKEPVKVKLEGDDAMIARRPLGGWSCASCEKKLESLTGRLAGHSPWKKLPLRDTSERMLKAGLGYSKMLTSLQLETLKSKVDIEEGLSQRLSDRSHTPFL